MSADTTTPANLAGEVYAYAYPLVTMEMTRRVMTNVDQMQGTSGPMGRLTKARVYRMRRSGMSPHPTPTRSTRWRG
jgi:hypothetical protein